MKFARDASDAMPLRAKFQSQSNFNIGRFQVCSWVKSSLKSGFWMFVNSQVTWSQKKGVDAVEWSFATPWKHHDSISKGLANLAKGARGEAFMIYLEMQWRRGPIWGKHLRSTNSQRAPYFSFVVLGYEPLRDLPTSKSPRWPEWQAIYLLFFHFHRLYSEQLYSSTLR